MSEKFTLGLSETVDERVIARLRRKMWKDPGLIVVANQVIHELSDIFNSENSETQICPHNDIGGLAVRAGDSLIELLTVGKARPYELSKSEYEMKILTKIFKIPAHILIEQYLEEQRLLPFLRRDLSGLQLIDALIEDRKDLVNRCNAKDICGFEECVVVSALLETKARYQQYYNALTG